MAGPRKGRAKTAKNQRLSPDVQIPQARFLPPTMPSGQAPTIAETPEYPHAQNASTPAPPMTAASMYDEKGSVTITNTPDYKERQLRGRVEGPYQENRSRDTYIDHGLDRQGKTRIHDDSERVSDHNNVQTVRNHGKNQSIDNSNNYQTVRYHGDERDDPKIIVSDLLLCAWNLVVCLIKLFLWFFFDVFIPACPLVKCVLAFVAMGPVVYYMIPSFSLIGRLLLWLL